jgi:hypothetical protein
MIRLIWVLAFFACPPVTILVYLLQRQRRQQQQPPAVTYVSANDFFQQARSTSNAKNE